MSMFSNYFDQSSSQDIPQKGGQITKNRFLATNKTVEVGKQESVNSANSVRNYKPLTGRVNIFEKERPLTTQNFDQNRPGQSNHFSESVMKGSISENKARVYIPKLDIKISNRNDNSMTYSNKFISQRSNNLPSSNQLNQS